jgi:hypothetical protein
MNLDIDFIVRSYTISPINSLVKDSVSNSANHIFRVALTIQGLSKERKMTFDQRSRESLFQKFISIN